MEYNNKSKIFTNLAEQETSINEFFVNRKDELRHLHRLLKMAINTPIFVVGARGVGKTAFCRMYEQIYSKSYQSISYLSSQEYMDFDKFVHGLVNKFSKSVKTKLATLNDVRKYLNNRTTDRKHLIIIDDIQMFSEQDLFSLLNNLINSSKNLSIILTSSTRTQFNIISSSLSYSTIILSALSEKDIYQLIKVRCKVANISTKISDKIYSNLKKHEINISELSPRFLLDFINVYLNLDNFDQALNYVRSNYTPSISNLIVSLDNDRFFVLPSTQDDPVNVISNSGQLIQSVPYIIIPNVRNIWIEQIKEFENIINQM